MIELIELNYSITDRQHEWVLYCHLGLTNLRWFERVVYKRGYVYHHNLCRSAVWRICTPTSPRLIKARVSFKTLSVSDSASVNIS